MAYSRSGENPTSDITRYRPTLPALVCVCVCVCVCVHPPSLAPDVPTGAASGQLGLGSGCGGPDGAPGQPEEAPLQLHRVWRELHRVSATTSGQGRKVKKRALHRLTLLQHTPHVYVVTQWCVCAECCGIVCTAVRVRGMRRRSSLL